jgi:predicted dehydrogenase
MIEKLRIGFIGAGDIVKSRHVPNLQNINDLEFAVVCNSTLESSQRSAQEIGAGDVVEDWHDIIHDSSIDIVWIGTWPYLHCPITIEALNAKKHVFCQARMAMNRSEARQMLDASKQSDRATMLCPPPFGLKGDNIMKEILDQEIIGEIYSIHFRDHSGIYLDHEAPITWRQRDDLSGLNTLMVGIYAEIIHRWFGKAKTISAQSKTFIQERPSGDGMMKVTRPDVVMAVSEMENGALMRWEWSGLAQLDKSSLVEAHGSKGVLCYNFINDEIFLSKDGKDVELIEITPDKERKWTVEHDFIQAIREGNEVHPNFEDGLDYMEFTEAVFQSVDSGKSIQLPLK